jgi:trans-L-3-hydroxyproline dehydratase
MYGAILTEPVTADAHAGILFMHNEGWSTMCGHGIIAVTTMAVDRGLITGSPDEIRYDTPAGRVIARVSSTKTAHGPRVASVSFVNVPSFVFEAGLPIVVSGRALRADVAFGGAFYAIVDAESAGIPILPERLPELRALGMAIAREVERLRRVVHPLDEGLSGIYGTIFTGPPQGAADLRNVTVFADAEVDRSPCGTGTAAVMAVLAEMGVLVEPASFVHESIVGTTFTGRVVGRTSVGEREAIVPAIEGRAWVTGEHAFHIDGEDPLKAGFRL